MAGNIIPAIASTNAIIAGVVVLRLMNVIQQKYEQCSTVYLRAQANLVGQMVVPERAPIPPVPHCFICGDEPFVILKCDIHKLTVKELQAEVMLEELHMRAPDAIVPATCSVVVSSEEEDNTESNLSKKLAQMGIIHGTILKVDDFILSYKLNIMVEHQDTVEGGPKFQIRTFDPTQDQLPTESSKENKQAEDDITMTDQQSPLKRKLSPEVSSTTASPPKKRLREIIEIDNTDKVFDSEDYVYKM